MLSKIKILVASSLILLGFVALPLAVDAQTVGKAREGVNAVGEGSNSISLEGGLKSVINILLFIIGIIAVIMIIIGGIRYVVSNGDSAAITGAKNTILYAIIGVIVAVLAYAIVNFVLDGLT